MTPQLRTDQGDTVLLLIDLGNGRNRLGPSALAQTRKQIGSLPPDLDNVEQFKSFFAAMQQLVRAGMRKDNAPVIQKSTAIVQLFIATHPIPMTNSL